MESHARGRSLLRWNVAMVGPALQSWSQGHRFSSSTPGPPAPAPTTASPTFKSRGPGGSHLWTNKEREQFLPARSTAFCSEARKVAPFTGSALGRCLCGDSVPWLRRRPGLLGGAGRAGRVCPPHTHVCTHTLAYVKKHVCTHVPRTHMVTRNTCSVPAAVLDAPDSREPMGPPAAPQETLFLRARTRPGRRVAGWRSRRGGER